MSDQRLNKATALANLPGEWPDDVLPAIRTQLGANPRKVVVLDDDPTGTQTVYDIPVLTEWSVESLARELQTDSSALYILTNSRSLPLAEAEVLNRDVAANLHQAAEQTERDFVIVSRSDSTLRGHFPGEVDALIDALGQSFDGWLIIPFFIEGGRYTLHDVHYVAEGDDLIPAAQTPFAQDAAFGYQSSNLREWVAEKTGRRVNTEAVHSISIDDIRHGGADAVADRLMQLSSNAICVINAAGIRDMQVFVCGLLKAEAQGKRFLYRTAASFVQARIGLAPRPLLYAPDLHMMESGGGLVIVGSYVPKTTRQVNALLKQTDITSLEIDCAALLDDTRRSSLIEAAVQQAEAALQNNQDVIIYTSRALISTVDARTSLSVGKQISSGLIAILRRIRTPPRYILAKGGITSSDVATEGLGVKRALVLGQILPGVPVWKLGAKSRFPDMPYIVFPGNVGDDNALATVVNKLRN